MTLDYWHKVLAYLEIATSGLLLYAKIHTLFLITQLNQWLNRWCKWAGQFLCIMFPKPCRAVVTYGYHCSQERDQLFQEVSQGIYNLPFTHSVCLFNCVLKISAPNMSLFLHWQNDVFILLLQKQLLGFNRWMEVEVSLVLCGKYVNWTFLLNWAPVKELTTFPLHCNVTC